MPPCTDLTGQRFGRLTVLNQEGWYSSPGHPEKKRSTWRCLCDCGRETVVHRTNLTTGNTTTCNHCMRPETARRGWIKRRQKEAANAGR